MSCRRARCRLRGFRHHGRRPRAGRRHDWSCSGSDFAGDRGTGDRGNGRDGAVPGDLDRCHRRRILGGRRRNCWRSMHPGRHRRRSRDCCRSRAGQSRHCFLRKSERYASRHRLKGIRLRPFPRLRVRNRAQATLSPANPNARRLCRRAGQKVGMGVQLWTSQERTQQVCSGEAGADAWERPRLFRYRIRTRINPVGAEEMRGWLKRGIGCCEGAREKCIRAPQLGER